MALKRDGKYQLKVNEELFKKWQQTGDSIKLLAGIVQNDLVCKGANIEEFVEATQKAQRRLAALIKETNVHIANTLKPIEDDSKPKKEKATMAYIDLTSDDDEPIYEKVTDKEYEKYLEHEAGGIVKIIKHPKF